MHSPSRHDDRRLPLVDLFKAVAAQLIVLHHLAFYGPLADSAQILAPTLVSWLSQYARIAVQVFLVVAGFLAARRLAPNGMPAVATPAAEIGRRYLRLAMPYLFALGIANVGAFIAGQWMQHDSIPAPPTPPQLIAHVLLLQDILDYDAMTAGAWYVAIDFQLFAATVLILWLAQKLGAAWRRPAMIGLVAVLAVASLLYFNLDPDWDAWAIFFFGAYGLGLLAGWCAQSPLRRRWLVLLAVAGLGLALANGRPHAWVALTTALALAVLHRAGSIRQWPAFGPIRFLGRISYAQFLVHFPVCLVVNALLIDIAESNPILGAIGMLAAWGASVVAGTLFFRFVEVPIAELFSPSAGRHAASGSDRRAQPAAHRG